MVHIGRFVTKSAFEYGTTVALVCLAAAALWNVAEDKRTLPAPSGVPPVGSASGTIPLGRHVIGSRSARVAIIEFSDFQCPYCARFAMQALPIVRRDLVEPGLMLYGFRHLPLEHIHPFALGAARAGECAGAQGRFWDIHDRLFAAQQDLTPANLITIASALGMRREAFTSCINGDHQPALTEDTAIAQRFDLASTPSFLIGVVNNGDLVTVQKKVRGAVRADVLKAVVAEVRTRVEG